MKQKKSIPPEGEDRFALMIFKDPWILILMPLLVPAVFWRHRRSRPVSLRFSSLDLVAPLCPTWKIRFAKTPFYLRLVVLCLVIIALAGPRSVLEETQRQTEGIDIVLALDASGSMAAEDFTLKGRRQNRLKIVKDVANEFIDTRVSDRLGLVAFGGRAYTVSPLTMDHAWVKTNLDRVSLDLLEDGTAIGFAISAAVSRLQKSRAASKVVILLTDGVNNRDEIDPLAAAQAARTLGIKIYTIGAGTNGAAPFPVVDVWGRKVYQNMLVEIDEETLRKIAEITGGRYFRATGTESLRNIFKEIDLLEKTKIEETGYREYRELFVSFLGAGLLLLLAAVVLERTVFLKIP